MMTKKATKMAKYAKIIDRLIAFSLKSDIINVLFIRYIIAIKIHDDTYTSCIQ